MNVPDIIIAVDGFSATGKSTFAKMVAKEFEFLYLDSGAMYRGVTLFAMENGMVAEDGALDEKALKAVVDDLDLHFRNDDGKTCLYLGERCIETEIRTLAVSSHVSPVSAIPFVRNYVDKRLRAFSEGGRVIMDGRDIGTVIMPDADCKMFVFASAKARAERRYKELIEKGQDVDFDDVLADIEKRDKNDREREIAPCVPAEDAILLDNSEINFEETVDAALRIIAESVK